MFFFLAYFTLFSGLLHSLTQLGLRHAEACRSRKDLTSGLASLSQGSLHSSELCGLGNFWGQCWIMTLIWPGDCITDSPQSLARFIANRLLKLGNIWKLSLSFIGSEEVRVSGSLWYQGNFPLWVLSLWLGSQMSQGHRYEVASLWSGRLGELMSWETPLHREGFNPLHTHTHTHTHIHTHTYQRTKNVWCVNSQNI